MQRRSMYKRPQPKQQEATTVSQKEVTVYRRRKYKLPPQITQKEEYLTMKFATRINIPAIAISVINYNNINIGSVFDPLGTLGTRQYYGTSQMFGLYRYATVMASKVKLTCLTPSTSSSPIVMMMTIQSSQNQDPMIGDLFDFYETPLRTGSKPKLFGDTLSKALDSNNSMYGTYSAKNLYGNKFDNTDVAYAAISTANPSQFGVLGLYATTPDGSTSTSINFMLELSSIVRWWDPISLGNN